MTLHTRLGRPRRCRDAGRFAARAWPGRVNVNSWSRFRLPCGLLRRRSCTLMHVVKVSAPVWPAASPLMHIDTHVAPESWDGPRRELG